MLEPSIIAEIKDKIALARILLSHFDQQAVFQKPVCELTGGKYFTHAVSSYRCIVWLLSEIKDMHQARIASDWVG